MNIRKANVADAAGIARVHIDSWVAAYRGVVADEILDNLSLERRTAGWTRLLENDSAWAFVATDDDGTVVGFASTASIERPEEDDEFEGLDPARTAELATIYLDPSVWGQGLGHALMDTALNDLRKRGFTSAVLWVLEGNKRARLFYEAGGWRDDGGRKDCFGSVQVQAPAVRYSIDL